MREFFSRLTWVDYILVIAFLRGGYVGYRSGLFPEILRFASYLATLLATFRFQTDLADFLTLRTFLNQPTAFLLATLALVIGVFLLAKLLSMMTLKILNAGEGGALNRLLGSLFGAARWFFLLSLLFMGINALPLDPLKTDIHERSLTGPRVARVAPALFDYMQKISLQLGAPSKKT